MPTLVSQSSCNLSLLPLNALNQVPAGYAPAYTRFSLVDNTAAAYTVTGMAWNGTTGIGTMTFIVPAVSSHATRTLTISLDGSPITVNPSPVTIDIVPPFHGRSVLTNSVIAWDMYVPDSATPQLFDFSGNGNFAVAQLGGGNLNPPTILGTQQYYVADASVYVAIGYSFYSAAIPPGFPVNNAPILNAQSILNDTFTGLPFQTISSAIMEINSSQCTVAVPVWAFKFRDSSGNTHGVQLVLSENDTATPTFSIVTTTSATSPTDWSSPVTQATATPPGITDHSPIGRLFLVTVTMAANGVGEIWINGTRYASGFNIFAGQTAPNPSGASTVTYFGGMGCFPDAHSGMYIYPTFGQCELVAYGTLLSGASVFTNASAWNLTGTATGPLYVG